MGQANRYYRFFDPQNFLLNFWYSTYATLRKIIKIPQQGLDFSKSTLLIIPKVDQVENIFDWVSGQNLVIWLNHFQPQKNLLFLSHSFVWGLQQLVAATGCFSINSITTTVLCK